MKHGPHKIYLGTRAIPPSLVEKHADALRSHPNCPCGPYRFPAMVALNRSIITGEPIGIHRTFLRDDGAGKREMPERHVGRR